MSNRKAPSVRFGGTTTFPAGQPNSASREKARSSTTASAWTRPSGARSRLSRKAGLPDDDSSRGLKVHTNQIIPGRASRISERLVLLPDTADDDEDMGDFNIFDGQQTGPPSDAMLQNTAPGLKTKSYAERLPKARRAEKVARVTAYCTAQSFKLKPTAEFVKRSHVARTKLYDDCLYCVYHLPLMDGEGGYRVKSGPVLKNPKGKAILDEEIERNERRDYEIGYFGDSEQFEVPNVDRDGNEQPDVKIDRERSPSPPPHQHASQLQLGEVFVFTYGVIVFWNFTQPQEKNILADLAFSASDTGVNPVIRPQNEDEIETEKFNFEYNPDIPHPRVYNDMFTLRSRDHMIKLTISHAVAQSTKLCLFEERMHRTMQETVKVPQVLAKTGELGMKRSDVLRTVGRLFQNRVDVNLSSNVLDVPKFFWDTEPTLHPLYTAVREYLEIQPRIQVLNERCQVFLDLASVMSDTLAHKRMSKLTWVIIILIVLSIMVTIGEVVLRFTIVTRAGPPSVPVIDSTRNNPVVGLIGDSTHEQRPFDAAQQVHHFPATSAAILSAIETSYNRPMTPKAGSQIAVHSSQIHDHAAFLNVLHSDVEGGLYMPMMGM